MDDRMKPQDEPARNADDSNAALLQMLDGCRPPHAVSHHLPVEAAQRLAQDPQAAEWHRRNVVFDAAVADAFAQVPLPLGMAARLAAALANETQESEVAQEAAAPVSLPAPPSDRRNLWHRRRWLTAAGSSMAATAAGWAAFAWWQGRSRSDLSLEQVLDESLAFHQRSAARRNEARPISENPPPAEFPLSRYVTPRTEPRVRQLDEPLLGRLGVAYELAPAGQPRAALYVVSERAGLRAPAVPLLPAEPSEHPFMTGGCAMSAWREESRIVLLVVEGDAARYREFLAAPKVFA